MKQLLAVWEFLEVAAIAIIIACAFKFLAQPFLVQGASMEPNFDDGDFLLVDEISYRFKEPERGDVIVFHAPTEEKQYYIKRIIGLPGETIVVEDGEVFINGVELEEEYLPQGMSTRTLQQNEFTLGANQFFVLGDNRIMSFDSRNWGPLDREEIVGVVQLRLWPLQFLDSLKEQSFYSGYLR
ncbi:MAG TPA: signal peptidase I [Candidatus Colwellbacteria bacterium]|nr:signal peptidase I [Candidatus Colwellbacteria bacterium]